MKKSILSIVAICLMCISLCACSPNKNVSPTEFLKVKQIEISVDAENEFIIETYNVYLTNTNYEPKSTLILASEHGNTTYTKHQQYSSLNEYNHIIESNIGKVKIQFELYLQVKYNNKTLPYTIRFSEYYYTKLQDNQILLYTDKKCTSEASFDIDVKDVHYSTGDIYNDSYKISLKIIVEQNNIIE